MHNLFYTRLIMEITEKALSDMVWKIKSELSGRWTRTWRDRKEARLTRANFARVRVTRDGKVLLSLSSFIHTPQDKVRKMYERGELGRERSGHAPIPLHDARRLTHQPLKFLLASISGERIPDLRLVSPDHALCTLAIPSPEAPTSTLYCSPFHPRRWWWRWWWQHMCVGTWAVTPGAFAQGRKYRGP